LDAWRSPRDGRFHPFRRTGKRHSTRDNCIQYNTEFFTTHKVSQATFQTALDQFGAQGLTELTTLMGYYALLAFNANAFEIDLPAGRTEPVLPI
jgi:hypothetical protein